MAISAKARALNRKVKDTSTKGLATAGSSPKGKKTKPLAQPAPLVALPAEASPEDATARLALLQAAGITPARMSRMLAQVFEVYEAGLVATKYTLGNLKKGRVAVPDFDVRLRAAKELIEVLGVKAPAGGLTIKGGKDTKVQVNVASFAGGDAGQA